MTLFKKLQDLDNEINTLNKDIDPGFALTANTDDLLDSICTVLSNECYSSYYANRFINNRIELFTFKRPKLDITLESKFIIDVYKNLYGRDEVVVREFLQFINPSSYVNSEKWVIGYKPFEYWCLDISIENNTLTAFIYIDHSTIYDMFSEMEDVELIPTIYNFRELIFPKKIRNKIVGLLDDMKNKIPTNQADQYQELCTVFGVRK